VLYSGRRHSSGNEEVARWPAGKDVIGRMSTPFRARCGTEQ